MTSNDRNSFGLSQRDMDTIRVIIEKYPDVRTVFIFGSRAKGNFNQGSDIDLAVMDRGVTDTLITRMKGDFDESTLPYFIDVVNYSTLQHPDLKSHIDRVGVPFYHRER